jgi:hypothetical protein
MTVRVTSDQVAALRSYLSGDFADYEERRGQIDRSPDRTGYMALVSAAFCEAVERRFSSQDPAERVLEFVADVRARFDRDGNQIDPRAAERMIRAVLSGPAQVAGLDQDKAALAAMALLKAFVIEEGLTGADLDAFLAESLAQARLTARR